MTLRMGLLMLAWSVLLCIAPAQTSQWRLLRPSNTGVPGNLVQTRQAARWSPDGKFWVAARWFFQEEGGIGMYDLNNDTWSVVANWETPLPSEFVFDVEFAADGSAWMATDSGLVHYDAGNWTIFDPTNSPLVHYEVQDISIAPDGAIWVNNTNRVTHGGDAVWRFDGVSQWQSFSVANGDLPWPAPWEELGEVYAAADGSVWVTNHFLAGVARYDGNSWTLFGDSLSSFICLNEDNNGNLWMIGNPAGGVEAIYKFDGATFTSWPVANPNTLTIDRIRNQIYVGTWDGVIYRSSDGGTTWPVFASGLNHVFSISPSPTLDEVWCGDYIQVDRFTLSGNLIASYNSYNTGLPDYNVDNLQLNRDGFFWVASGDGGLSRFDGERWRNWGAHNLGSEPYPFGNNEPMGGFFLDSQGNGWMGGIGIARWDPQSGQFTGYWNTQNNPGMTSNKFWEFAEDMNGTIWAIAGFSALYQYDPSSNLWVREIFGPPPYQSIPTMATDSQGNLWVGGATNGLFKWDGQSWTVVGANWPFFQQAAAGEIAFGPGDVLWIATGIGLWRWDGVNLEQFDTMNSPLITDNLFSIDVRSDGVVGLCGWEWPAGSDPIANVAVINGDPNDPNNWSVYQYGQSPLPFYHLNRVAFDGQGDLWVSAVGMGVAILDFDNPPVGIEDEEVSNPRQFSLGQNYPNPFNPSTTISFVLPTAAPISLEVFDITGRRVRTLVEGQTPAGRHEVVWDGRDERGSPVASGLYLYRLEVNQEMVQTRKMALIR